MGNTKKWIFLLVLMALSFPSLSIAAETEYLSPLKGNSVVTIVVEKEESKDPSSSDTVNGIGEGTNHSSGNSSESKWPFLPKTGNVRTTLYSSIGISLLVLLVLWKKRKGKVIQFDKLYID